MIHPQINAAEYDIDVRDYKVGALPFGIILKDINSHICPEINQNEEQLLWNSCTIGGAYKDICRVNNVPANQEEFKDIVQWCADNTSFNPAKGWKTSLGVLRACQRRNQLHPDMPVVYFGLHIATEYPLILEALEKGYWLGCSYGGDSAYNEDSQSDGLLNGDSFGVSYRHRPSLSKRGIEENYAGGIPYNTYGLNHSIKHLVDNHIYDDYFYLILPSTEEQNERLLTQAEKDQSSLKKAEDMGLWNGKDNLSLCIRQDIILMAMRAKGFNEPTDEQMLFKAMDSGYWNGYNGNKPARRDEAVLILSRIFFGVDSDENSLKKMKNMGIWNGMHPEAHASREQCVLMLMRVLNSI